MTKKVVKISPSGMGAGVVPCALSIPDWEPRSHMLSVKKSGEKNQKQHCNKFNEDFKIGPHPKKKNLIKTKSLGWEDPLKKGKATHSSTLACRIRHDWATFALSHTSLSAPPKCLVIGHPRFALCFLFTLRIPQIQASFCNVLCPFMALFSKPKTWLTFSRPLHLCISPHIQFTAPRPPQCLSNSTSSLTWTTLATPSVVSLPSIVSFSPFLSNT